MTHYHVVSKWNGNDLQSAKERLGEQEAIEQFMKKWDTDDASWAADQVGKLFFYETKAEAIEHKSTYGGEILEVDLDDYEVYVDSFEKFPFTDMAIRAENLMIVEDK